MATKKDYSLKFRGGKAMSLVPLGIFIIFCIAFFVVFQIYEMDALAMGGFVALILGSFLAKNIGTYWDAAVKGMSSEIANTLTLILFVVGIFSKLMTYGGVAEGFVWIGDKLNLSGSLFSVFTFMVTAILATATGTSIGTIITGMSILYPSGLLLGAHPVILAGAILSGALFGDSIGPVSDVTIASCATQEYHTKSGSADIGGMVSSRVKYSLVSGAITIVLFFIFGGEGSSAIDESGSALLAQYSNPKGLLMLIPVVLLLIVAIITKNIYLAATTGIISGAIVALAFGIFPASTIISVNDGVLGGFIIEGIRGMLGTVAYLYALFAIMGVMQESGMMDSIIESLMNSKLSKTVVGTELLIAAGSCVSGFCLGGANGPACIMFGPIAGKLGQQQRLHPYRRGNLLAGFASAIPVLIPFASLFISIAISTINGLRDQYDFVPAVNPAVLPTSMFFCYTYAAVWLFSIFTGWGREYEGPDGKPVRSSADAAEPEVIIASESGQ